MILKIKNQKTFIFIQHKVLNFLTGFFSHVNESFTEQHAKEFYGKNIIFVSDPNFKSKYIVFKFDLTKIYIKQFLLSSSPRDFNKFVHESIKDKIKTDPNSKVIGTPDKYLQAQHSVAAFTYRENIYIVNNTQIPSIFITPYFVFECSNKSFVRGLTEIGHSQPTAKMIKELRKELMTMK